MRLEFAPEAARMGLSRFCGEAPETALPESRPTPATFATRDPAGPRARTPQTLQPAAAPVALQLSRYAAVSAAALALDFTVFVLLVADGLGPTLAGVASYAIGIALHFSLSLRHVFASSRTGKSERRLFAEFAASGLVGLALTATTIAVATQALGAPPLLAKVAAAAVSFLAVFAIRRGLVFRASPAAP